MKLTPAETLLAATLAERQARAELDEATEALLAAQKARVAASDRWTDAVEAKNKARQAAEELNQTTP